MKKSLIYQFRKIDRSYKFADLFDLEEIQKIQDLFSDATGVASIITEPDGTPITKPSNFCSLCKDLIRKSEIGLKNCLLSDSIIGRPSAKGPRIQKCLSGGLIDAGASIFFNNKQIAIWLVGQVIYEDCNLDEMLAYADVIGVDRNLYKNELLKVKRISKKQFKNICDFLFFNAQQLSKYASKNVSLTNEIHDRILVEREIKKLNIELDTIISERTNELQRLNAELEETNAMLEEEINERQMAEEELRNLNSKLEAKVKERTTELEKVNIELVKREEDLRHLLNSTAQGIYGLDTKGNCTFCNESCLKMLGYKHEEELVGKNMHKLIHHKRSDNTPLPIEECQIYSAFLRGQGTHVDSEVFWRADGTCFPVEYFSYPQLRNGKIIGAVVSFMDISKRKKTEEEIIFLSYHDQLTGLYNRRFFEQELARLDAPNNYPLSIIMGDMNGLKLVNDSLGHSVGDELLKKAAKVLAKGCRSHDILARLGGDEFIVLLPKTDSYETERIIERIKALAVQERIGSIEISISLGYATKKHSQEEMKEVLRKAEDNMYKQKLLESPSMRGKTVDTIIRTLYEKSRREEAHSHRVSNLCVRLGRAIGAHKADIEELKTAGLLHDIGKVAIDGSILNKPSRLSEDEWRVIKRHPEIGYRILSTVIYMSDIAEYILAHHERWDGSGYPKGLKGNEIMLKSRIISIADAYDAMTSLRSYRSPLSKEEAIYELQKNAGIQFDPELVSVFIEKVV